MGRWVKQVIHTDGAILGTLCVRYIFYKCQAKAILLAAFLQPINILQIYNGLTIYFIFLTQLITYYKTLSHAPIKIIGMPITLDYMNFMQGKTKPKRI